MDYVAQKNHILSDKPTRNPTSLVATDHKMNKRRPAMMREAAGNNA